MNYSVSGTLTYDDNDFYRIQIPKNGRYSLAGVTEEDSLLDLGAGLIDRYDEELITPVGYKEYERGWIKEYELKAGTYYMIALDLNNVGNSETYLLKLEAYENVVDTTPPKKPKVNQVDDNDTVVTGTAEPNSYVRVQIGDDWANDGTLLVNSNGDFSVKIKPQKAGTYIGVTLKDDAGNQSEFANQWVIDKTPPKTLTVNKVTSKTTSINGKTEAKASVEVKLGSKSFGKATADSKGNYKVKIKAQKKDKKLTVIARDKAKNAKTVTVTVK